VTSADEHSDPTPRRTGTLFVVSGPSGVGKTTLLRRVLSVDRGLAFGVSHTTRSPRAGERNGEDYHFVDDATFDRGLAEGAFLEWAVYQGHRYGTSLEAVEMPTRKGLDVILEVEVQGARQLRERLPSAVFVFVLCPSMECLERRLRDRRSDSEEAIRERLARAREEVREVHRYDYVVVNDDLDQAVAALLNVIGASRIARERILPQLRDRFDFG
jgi:guanylate kinase